MYEQLLEALLEAEKPITIEAPVTSSAIYKGLRRVIKNTNTSHELLGTGYVIDKSPSVKSLGGSKYMIELVDGDTQKGFQQKFSFTIIDDGEDSDEEEEVPSPLGDIKE